MGSTLLLRLLRCITLILSNSVLGGIGIYQLFKEKGGSEYQQEIILQLLEKLAPDQVADLSGILLDKVRDIATKSKYQ